MIASKGYPFWRAVLWSRKYILLFFIIDAIPVGIFYIYHIEWLLIPWQPISVIGIAVSFYLGFKNNSSYDRLWEGRKIWGGIVNSSRTITVMIRDFITNENVKDLISAEELKKTHKAMVYRHIAWIKALTYQLREKREWEHHKKKSHEKLRKNAGINSDDDHFIKLKKYLSPTEYDYILQKGNKASHILSLQSKSMLDLKKKGLIENFRHIKLMDLVEELYGLQGKSERIKNFPFPRQYASVNQFFVWIFILLVPFGMLTIFHQLPHTYSVFFVIPFSVLISWVFIMMELVGEYSENPFEGLFNDVPITTIATDIEIDILQMIEEKDLPNKVEPIGEIKISV